jgi:hypothetical protein
LFVTGYFLESSVGIIGYDFYDIYVLGDVEGRIAEVDFYLVILFWLLLLEL